MTDDLGRRQVVRNGYLPEREIMTSLGSVDIKVPKTRDRGGQKIHFRSELLPPYIKGFKSPRLAVGDGALGFWKALIKVLGQTRSQRCWVHKTANIFYKLPKHSQTKAKQQVHDIWMAETREDAEKALDLFLETYNAKYPKATQCLEKDRQELLAFSRFPCRSLGAYPDDQSD